MNVSARMVGNSGAAMMTAGRIRFAPVSYRKHCVGGPADATVMAYGSVESLCWLLTRAPAQEMRLFNAIGQMTWWGQARQVKARLGDVLVDVSLDTPKNRIVVRYYKIVHPADPNGDVTTTPFAEDAYSVARWGKLEMLITQNRLKQADAEKLRDDQLSARRFPSAGIEAARREFSAEIFCRGWWDTLNDQLYEHKAGLEQFTEQQNFAHNVGEATGVDRIAQRVNIDAATTSPFTLTSIALRLSKTGNPTDSLQVKVKRGAWGRSGSHRAATAYVGGNAVNIKAGEDWLRAGDYVTDSTSPNTPTAATGDANSYLVSGYGLSKTLHRDHGYYNANVDIPFYIPCSDGATLATATIPASQLSDRQYEYVLTLDTPITLSASALRTAPAGVTTTINTAAEVWIEVSRTGSNDGSNYYSVGMSTQALYPRGECKIRVAGVFTYWRPTVPDPASMWFKAMGYQSSEQIIGDMVGAAQWLRGWVVRDASNQTGEQYRDGTQTVLSELERILKRGVKDGRRYICTVTPDRWLDIQQEPSSASTSLRLKPDGTLYDGGRRLRRDLCIVGRYARVDGVDISDYALADAGLKFLEEASYDCATDRLDTRGRNRNAMFDITAVAS